MSIVKEWDDHNDFDMLYKGKSWIEIITVLYYECIYQCEDQLQ